MSEVKRLAAFYPFDNDVLGNVERAARRQQGLPWPDYMRQFDIPQPQVYLPRHGRPIEVLDISPEDYEDTLVYHQPMACSLNPEIMLHVATLAAVQPEKRIIAVGNPGPPGHGHGKLPAGELKRVWKGDLYPTVIPTLDYLNSRSVKKADHIGESYGADKAAASLDYSEIYGVEVVRSVMIEPVSVVKAGLLKMGWTFRSTKKHKDQYLNPVRQRSDTLLSAEALTPGPYALGVIGRLSNLAIAHALGLQGYRQRVDTALENNKALKVGIAWGTASEFDRTNQRFSIVHELIDEHSRDRVVPMPLNGETHAMSVDFFLNAAIYSQLLKETI
jgi:hypothetical protein